MHRKGQKKLQTINTETNDGKHVLFPQVFMVRDRLSGHFYNTNMEDTLQDKN